MQWNLVMWHIYMAVVANELLFHWWCCHLLFTPITMSRVCVVVLLFFTLIGYGQLMLSFFLVLS